MNLKIALILFALIGALIASAGHTFEGFFVSSEALLFLFIFRNDDYDNQ